MRNRCKPAVAALLFFMIIAGCTDVPLSQNTKVFDQSVFGFWQSPSVDGYEIYKLGDGTAGLRSYEYDFTTEKFNKKTEYGQLYFTEIIKNGITYRFINVKDGEAYETFRFSFDGKGNLVLRALSESYMEKFKKKAKGGDAAFEFKNSKKFREFVTEKLGETALFESESDTYEKRRSVKEFEIPGF